MPYSESLISTKTTRATDGQLPIKLSNSVQKFACSRTPGYFEGIGSIGAIPALADAVVSVDSTMSGWGAGSRNLSVSPRTVSWPTVKGALGIPQRVFAFSRRSDFLHWIDEKDYAPRQPLEFILTLYVTMTPRIFRVPITGASYGGNYSMAGGLDLLAAIPVVPVADHVGLVSSSMDLHLAAPPIPVRSPSTEEDARALVDGLQAYDVTVEQKRYEIFDPIPVSFAFYDVLKTRTRIYVRGSNFCMIRLNPQYVYLGAPAGPSVILGSSATYHYVRILETRLQATFELSHVDKDIQTNAPVLGFAADMSNAVDWDTANAVSSVQGSYLNLNFRPRSAKRPAVSYLSGDGPADAPRTAYLTSSGSGTMNDRLSPEMSSARRRKSEVQPWTWYNPTLAAWVHSDNVTPVDMTNIVVTEPIV